VKNDVLHNELNVLHVIPSIALKHGGPSRSSVNLVNYLSVNSNLILHFYTYQSPDHDSLDLSSAVVRHFQSESISVFSVFRFKDFFKIRRIIREENIEIVHLHGVWHPLFHWAAKAAFKEGKPYIIHPRGMLEPWAMRYKKLKKSLAMFLYQRGDLLRARGFIATSDQEANAVSALGLSSAIEVISNGIEVAVSNRQPSVRVGCKTVLFMSRIHVKKGVKDLILAWAALKPECWQLRIAGPDDGGYLKEITSLIATLNIGHSVEIVGPVYGEAREREYLKADLFVLPTYSENFGIAIAEALSYGIPVITTTGAPWSSLLDYRCGWWIEPGEQSLLKCLPNAMSTSDAERLEMGERAKSLAALFDWTEVAERTYKFYEKILSIHS
jgi:glycosyltransferase involved in cell wall biosynthesis